MSAKAEFVPAESLSDEELQELLGWKPAVPPAERGQAPAASARDLLLARARNCYPQGLIPIDAMSEAS